MKEKTQTKIAISIVVGIFVILLFLFTEIVSLQEDGWARLAGHLYPGDHITLNIDLKANDVDIPVSNLNITCDLDGELQNISIFNESIRTHGGHYGIYYFNIIIPADLIDAEEGLPIRLEYYNKNNWYIVTHDCDIKLTESEDGYRGTLDVTSEYNNGQKETLSIDFEKEEDRTLSVRWAH